jgi:carbon storage regulator
MLVISRRKGQSIAIGDDIELVVTELHRSSVKLGIRAPRGLAVLRGEVRESIEAANREAAETVLDGVELDGVELTATLVPVDSPQAPTDLLKARQASGDKVAPQEQSTLEVIIRRRPVAAQPQPQPQATAPASVPGEPSEQL